MDKRLKAFRAFLKLESAGGIILMGSAILAMICANSALGDYYDSFLHTHFAVSIGEYGLDKSISHWINDGLMVVFFLLVGLEIKREIIEGELSTLQQALLPLVAAFGGVAVPALIYTYFNRGDPVAGHGWAIPSATDIAFALGVLALLGSRVPIALKVFLTAVAVIDDLAAIIIIALFYTANLSLQSLAVAGTCIAVLFVMNRLGVRALWLFLLVGFIMWLAVLQSGVHATLAGVALGLMIPHKDKTRHGESMLRAMEHGLHPWVAYLILPLFAFANAGVHFGGLTLEAVFAPITIGIAAGLFFGKQIGIFSASWLLIKLGYAKLPSGANWKQLYGVSVLCGIGFTMSLFIGILAFETNLQETETKLGVMIGSLLSGIVGYLILSCVLPKKSATN